MPADAVAPPSIPPPQVVAMQVYIDFVTNLDARKATPDEVAVHMRHAIIAAIESACRAQRAADALLLRVIGQSSVVLGEREASEKFAQVLDGEVDPRKSELVGV